LSRKDAKRIAWNRKIKTEAEDDKKKKDKSNIQKRRD
jgi:hypothetical protein